MLKAFFDSKSVRLVIALFTLYAIYLLHTNVVSPFLSRPEVKAAKVEIDETKRDYLVTVVYDHGVNYEQYVFMAFSVQNLANEKKVQVSVVYDNAWEMAAPSQSRDVIKWYPRKWTMDTLSRSTQGKRALRREAEEAVDAMLKDPASFIEKHPWLTCVTRFIRSWEPWLGWVDEKAMERDMGKPIHVDALGAKYYCRGLQKQSQLRPPGGKPPASFFVREELRRNPPGALRTILLSATL